MRYTHKSGDWVELTGVDEWPMRDILALFKADMEQAIGMVKPAIADWHMTARGQDVAVGDVEGLPLKKWVWLRDRFMDAARDAALDPEA